jgi:hypothetical protein
MNLDEGQRKKVSEWIAEGLKLSDIQNRLVSEFGLRLTYIDVRLLVDDLKLVPKDAEPPKSPPSVLASGATPASGEVRPPAEPARPHKGGVTVSVDQIARPGAVASGKVTFSDGKTGEWYFDQTGRLGMVPPQTGYRPSPSDLQEFQLALDRELSQLGF